MAKKRHNINVKINSRSVYSTEVSLGKKTTKSLPRQTKRFNDSDKFRK